jgi:hypothetical protein
MTTNVTLPTQDPEGGLVEVTVDRDNPLDVAEYIMEGEGTEERTRRARALVDLRPEFTQEEWTEIVLAIAGIQEE